jgi:hypothetical protein
MAHRRFDSTLRRGVAALIVGATALPMAGCRAHKSAPGTDTAPPEVAQTPGPGGAPESSPGVQAPPGNAPSAGGSPSSGGSPAAGAVPDPSAPTTPAAIAAIYASRPASLASLSLAEFQYGTSPTRSSDVTYQPNVVVMEHGADAIHGYSSDGLTWLLDPNAPHVSELQPDKIMFATGRAVGRILSVTKQGNDVAVTLGPAALTDIVSDVQMAFEQPVDLSSVIVYTAPNAPLSGDLAPLVQDTTKTSDTRAGNGDQVVIDDRGRQTGSIVPVSLRSRPPIAAVPALWRKPAMGDAQGGPVGQVFNLVGPMIGVPRPVTVSGFKVSPYSGGGMGISIATSSPNLMMAATGGVRLDQPTVKVTLDIKHGTVQTAELELRGVAALFVDLQAGTQVGRTGNISKVYYVPTDMSIPILGKVLPIAITFRQSFLVETAFTAKNSTLNAGGEEDFTGAVTMGLHNGSWAVSAPTSMTDKRDLLQSINGVSLGASSVIFGWGTKVIVGLGAFGFATGPYIGYNTQVAIVRGSDLTTGLVPVPPCHGAILSLSLNVGVGYSLPAPLVSAVNAILHLLQLNTTLAPTNGISHQENIIRKEKSVPNKCASF